MDERERALASRMSRTPAQPAASRRHDAPIEGEAGRRWDRPASQPSAPSREEIERQLQARWRAEVAPDAPAPRQAPAEALEPPQVDPRAAILAGEPIWQPQAWERPAAPAPSAWSAAAPQPAAAPTVPYSAPAPRPDPFAALGSAVVEDLDQGRRRVEELRRQQEYRHAEEAKFAEEMERRRVLHERALEQRRLTFEAQLLEEIEMRRADEQRRFAEWRTEQIGRFEQELALRALEFERRLQERRSAEERALEDLRRQHELRLAQRSRDEEVALTARLKELLDGFAASRDQIAQLPPQTRAALDLAVRDGSDALRRAGEQMYREQAADPYSFGVADQQPQQQPADPRVAYFPRAVNT